MATLSTPSIGETGSIGLAVAANMGAMTIVDAEEEPKGQDPTIGTAATSEMRSAALGAADVGVAEADVQPGPRAHRAEVAQMSNDQDPSSRSQSTKAPACFGERLDESRDRPWS